jgi:hypothetical protein
MTIKLPLTETSLPHYVEFTADGTAVGKSFFGTRVRYHYELAGLRTTLVRIESRGVDKPLRKTDVYIPVENFAQASRLPGGMVGVLRPLFDAIAAAAKTQGVVIVDWAGGLARLRVEMLASTRFDERLAELGVAGLSFFVTTNPTDRMRQAAANLADSQLAAPGLARALLLNKRLGDFDFLAGSGPAAAFRDLHNAAQGCPVLAFEGIAGESWKICEDAALTMPFVVRSKPAEIAARTGLDDFTAAACGTEVAAWWATSDAELQRVLRFRPAPAK